MDNQVLEHEGKTIYNAGIEEGRRKANFETTRRLRDMGMSDNDIHKATNLSLGEIRIL